MTKEPAYNPGPCEGTYRRGFDHGVCAMVEILKGFPEAHGLLTVAEKIAGDMRFAREPIPDYMDEFQKRVEA